MKTFSEWWQEQRYPEETKAVAMAAWYAAQPKQCAHEWEAFELPGGLSGARCRKCGGAPNART